METEFRQTDTQTVGTGGFNIIKLNTLVNIQTNPMFGNGSSCVIAYNPVVWDVNKTVWHGLDKMSLCHTEQMETIIMNKLMNK